MMQDYSESNTLHLTHETVAGMIGTRRAGVSMATRALRQMGVISSERGQIKIIDREGLEGVACECSIIREEYAQLHRSQIAASPLKIVKLNALDKVQWSLFCKTTG